MSGTNVISVNADPPEDDGDGGFYVDFTVEIDNPGEAMPTVAAMKYVAEDSSKPKGIRLDFDGPSSVYVDNQDENNSNIWVSDSQTVDVDCSKAETYPVILTITPYDQKDTSIAKQVSYNGDSKTELCEPSSASTSDVEIIVRIKGGRASVKTGRSKRRPRR